MARTKIKKIAAKMAIRKWTVVLPRELMLQEQGGWKSSILYRGWSTAYTSWNCWSELSWQLFNLFSCLCNHKRRPGSALPGGISHLEKPKKCQSALCCPWGRVWLVFPLWRRACLQGTLWASEIWLCTCPRLHQAVSFWMHWGGVVQREGWLYDMKHS